MQRMAVELDRASSVGTGGGKGRSGGCLGKATGDMFFGMGQNLPAIVASPASRPPAEWGQQGLEDARQGVGEPTLSLMLPMGSQGTR